MWSRSSPDLIEWLPAKSMATRTGRPSNGVEGVAQPARMAQRTIAARKLGSRVERIARALTGCSGLRPPPVAGEARSSVLPSGALPQEQMQVRLLPGPRPDVAGEGTLALAELGAVHHAPAVAPNRGRNGLVQHLVEDDQLHEVAGHLLVVERGMDADELLLVEVDAHLHRAAPSEGRPPAPSDARVDLAAELLGVEAGEDRRQVVHAAALLEGGQRAVAGRADEVAVIADVCVDGAAVGAAVAAGEPGQRADHVLVCDGEHVVQSEAHAPLQALVRNHGPGVVGELYLDRLPHQPGELVGEDRARVRGGSGLRRGGLSGPAGEQLELQLLHALHSKSKVDRSASGNAGGRPPCGDDRTARAAFASERDPRGRDAQGLRDDDLRANDREKVGSLLVKSISLDKMDDPGPADSLTRRIALSIVRR